MESIDPFLLLEGVINIFALSLATYLFTMGGMGLTLLRSPRMQANYKAKYKREFHPLLHLMIAMGNITAGFILVVGVIRSVAALYF